MRVLHPAIEATAPTPHQQPAAAAVAKLAASAALSTFGSQVVCTAHGSVCAYDPWVSWYQQAQQKPSGALERGSALSLYQLVQRHILPLTVRGSLSLQHATAQCIIWQLRPTPLQQLPSSFSHLSPPALVHKATPSLTAATHLIDGCACNNIAGSLLLVGQHQACMEITMHGNNIDKLAWQQMQTSSRLKTLSSA